jgi:hypothetical protein
MELQEADVAIENKTQFLPDPVVCLMCVCVNSSQLVMAAFTRGGRRVGEGQYYEEDGSCLVGARGNTGAPQPLPALLPFTT